MIVIQQSNSVDTTLDVQEGMVFDRGYIDRSLVAPNESRESVLENAYVLTCESKISSMKDLLPILEQVAKSARPLLIIAEDVDGEALATLAVNRERGTLNCLAVKAPGFGDRRKSMLQDIAVLTGGLALTIGLGRRLESMTRDDTTILGGAGETNLKKHVETIREELSRTADPFAVEKLRERLARLCGAVVVIRVGGVSGEDISDRTYWAESAMYSVQKASEEGYVLGGGISLLRAKPSLKNLHFKKPGEAAGVKIVAEALEEPIRQLLLNSRKDPEEVLKVIRRNRNSTVGFDVLNDAVHDLVATGIVDPVVTITKAVQLASSHARTILETAAWDSTSVPKIRREPIGFRADQNADF